MKDFIKQYGGWIVTGLLAAVILYLVFRKVPVNDNAQAFKTIDSLTVINKSLNGQLTNFAYQYGMNQLELTHQKDSLLAQNDFLKLRGDAAYQSNQSLAKQVQYYRVHKDTIAYDSACDRLALQVINDSVVLSDYILNTDKLVQNFTGQILDRDSMITYQSNLIVSDSLLIKAQSKLNTTQQAQLKQMTKRAKLTAWIARGLAVTTGVLFIMFEAK